MPTKPNKAGQQQPYVPAGNGDASGEYSEHGTGSNRHYASPEDTKRQLGYQTEQPKPESTIPKDVENKLNGVKEQPKEKEITEEMKSIDYTRKLVQDAQVDNYFGLHTRPTSVSITRGSLTKDELGEFNKQIEDLYNEYPEMQKLTEIKVNNAKASSRGGYICTYGSGSNRAYELYINAGWLDKTPGERARDENIDWYKRRIENIEQGLKNNEYVESSIESVKNSLEDYKQKLANYEKGAVYNVIYKSSNRKDRLKSLLAHELMHRVTQTFDYYNLGKYAGDVEKNNAIHQRHREITQKLRDVYSKALQNGDAKNISVYATTSRDEFISEANSQMSLGIEVPQYIREVIDEMKTFVRSEK